jgi:alpha-L-fucosidase
MNRRDVLKCMAIPAAGAVLKAVAPSLLAAEPALGPATEMTPALAAYQKLRFGCCYHFSIDTFVNNGEQAVGAAPVTMYDPTHLDVRQWIRVAKELGARYAVITAKFWSGFCLWDSKGYDYDVAATRNQTDVVAAFVAACREYGLRPGFYYCIMDPRNEGRFDWDSQISDKYFHTPLIRTRSTSCSISLGRSAGSNAGICTGW